MKAMSNNISRRSFLECMACFAAGQAFAAPPGMFSGANPKLVFAAMTDIHVCHPKTGRNLGTEVFEHALEWYRTQMLDAVLVAGDLAEHGLTDELEMMGEAWRKMFPGNRRPDGGMVEKVFVTGNHDWEGWKYGDFVKKLYPREKAQEQHRLAAHYSETWESAFGEKYEPIYMKNIRGYRFIGGHWEKGNSRQFGERLSGFLKKHSDELRGEKPFFYFQHPHLRGTVFEVKTGVCDDGKTTEALSSFPNAVTFSGHSHWSITDERSIVQDAFTSVNLGCLRRAGFRVTKNSVLGVGYENWRTPGARKSEKAREINREKVMPQYPAHRRCHQGVLVKVFDDRIVIERREFGGGASVAPDWVIPLPVSKERPYDFKKRSVTSIAPAFPQDAELKVERITAQTRGGKSESSVKLVFPAANAKKGVRPYDYRIEIIDGTGKSTFRAVLAEGVGFGVESELAQGPSSCVLARKTLPKGPLTFKVYPGECFGKLGEPIAANFNG